MVDNPDDDNLARDCAATAEVAAALRPRLSAAHDCTAVEARLARAVAALRTTDRQLRTAMDDVKRGMLSLSELYGIVSHVLSTDIHDALAEIAGDA